ncbi:hypothetical protein PtB15_10B566 [Puccinia triticina]|nr:hypothetical protein PtB15_10B566 [Puccinia triticina]
MARWRPHGGPLGATALKAAPTAEGRPRVSHLAPPSEAAVRPSRPGDFMAVRPRGVPEATPGRHHDALRPHPKTSWLPVPLAAWRRHLAATMLRLVPGEPGLMRGSPGSGHAGRSRSSLQTQWGNLIQATPASSQKHGCINNQGLIMSWGMATS